MQQKWLLWDFQGHVKWFCLQSSHCGTTGSAASWECWDVGSIPSLTQWFKDLAFLGHNCGLDLIPGPGIPYAEGQPKKENKKQKKRLRFPVSSFLEMLVLETHLSFYKEAQATWRGHRWCSYQLRSGPATSLSRQTGKWPLSENHPAELSHPPPQSW